MKKISQRTAKKSTTLIPKKSKEIDFEDLEEEADFEDEFDDDVFNINSEVSDSSNPISNDQENDDSGSVDNKNNDSIQFCDSYGNIKLNEFQKTNFEKLLIGEICNAKNEKITKYSEQIETIHKNFINRINSDYSRSIILDQNDFNYLDYNNESNLNTQNNIDLPFREKVNIDPETCLDQMNNKLKDVIMRKYGKDISENGLFYVRIKSNQSNKDVLGFEQLSGERMERLITIQGIVDSISDKETKRMIDVYICKNPECGDQKMIIQDLNNHNKAPGKCSSNICQGRFSEKNWIRAKKLCKTMDIRHIKIREESNNENPRFIGVFLSGDLINTCDLGKTVSITGILHGFDGDKVTWWKEEDKLPIMQKNIWATYVETIDRNKLYSDDTTYTEDDFFDKVTIKIDGIRYFGDERDEKLPKFTEPEYLTEIIPSIKQKKDAWLNEVIDNIISGVTGGDYMRKIKQGIIYWLSQGVEYVFPDGSQKRRSLLHILIVGDPGVAKTKIGKSVQSYIPGCKYASVTTCTATGLTAAVDIDEYTKVRIIKAGPLVLGNNVGAVVDELARFDSDNLTKLFQLMEDGCIDINKAGLNYHLPSNTPILALTNPRNSEKSNSDNSYYDIARRLKDNVKNVPGPLLSRFDLKYIMFAIDPRNRENMDVEELELMQEENARKIARFIINNGKDSQTENKENNEQNAQQKFIFLQKYFNFVRERIEKKAKLYKSLLGVELIKISPQSAEFIEDEYIDIIRSDFTSSVRKFTDNNRMIESMMRIATADAKFFLQDTIHIDNTERAVKLYRQTIEDATTIYGENGLADVNEDDLDFNDKYKDNISFITDAIIEHEYKATFDDLIDGIKKYKKCVSKGTVSADAIAKRFVKDLINKKFVVKKDDYYELTNEGLFLLPDRKREIYRSRTIMLPSVSESIPKKSFNKKSVITEIEEDEDDFKPIEKKPSNNKNEKYAPDVLEIINEIEKDMDDADEFVLTQSSGKKSQKQLDTQDEIANAIKQFNKK